MAVLLPFKQEVGVKVSCWKPVVTREDRETKDEARTVRNLLGLPALPTLSTDRAERGHATKVSYELTEQVKLAVTARYKGVKLTKRAALEVALGEWLTAELERGRLGR